MSKIDFDLSPDAPLPDPPYNDISESSEDDKSIKSIKCTKYIEYIESKKQSDSGAQVEISSESPDTPHFIDDCMHTEEKNKLITTKIKQRKKQRKKEDEIDKSDKSDKQHFNNDDRINQLLADLSKRIEKPQYIFPIILALVFIIYLFF